MRDAVKPWDNYNCKNLRAFHEHYSVPRVAMLWCGGPLDEMATEDDKVKPIKLAAA